MPKIKKIRLTTLSNIFNYTSIKKRPTALFFLSTALVLIAGLLNPTSSTADAAIAYLPITYANVGAETVSVPLMVENIQEMTGGQFLLTYSGDVIAEVEAVNRAELTQGGGFVYFYNNSLTDSLRVSFSQNPPMVLGTGQLLEIVFRLQPGLPAGAETPLTFVNFGMYHGEGESFVTGYSGAIIIRGLLQGDFTGDHALDVRDLMRLVEVVANPDGSYTDDELWHSDMDNDGEINNFDIQYLVQMILNL